jgi:hypothetical protein
MAGTLLSVSVAFEAIGVKYEFGTKSGMDKVILN